MLVIFIIGIVIIMLSYALEGEDDEKAQSVKNNSGEEAQLGEILSEMNGAGDVTVMISYEELSEKPSGIGMSYGVPEGKSKPRGVIIVADGADNPSVRASLKEAAVAVTGVGANRVCVFDRDYSK